MCITSEQAVQEELLEDVTNNKLPPLDASQQALWTTCCWTRILDLQFDLVNKVPKLQQLHMLQGTLCPQFSLLAQPN